MGSPYNAYYFLDTTTALQNPVYYADQFYIWIDGACYLTVTGPTSLQPYTASQALTQLRLNPLPYDFEIRGSPRPFDCTTEGLYTLPIFTFPNDFPVQSTIPPTNDPTGKGQIYISLAIHPL